MPASPFGSLVTAMVTPFTADGAVDYARTEQLVDRLINQGTQTILVAGTTGESPTLTHHEKVELFRLTKRAAGGRAQVMAGTGSYNTAETIAFTKEAEALGVDSALLVTPYYNKPSQEGLYQHFKAAAAATGLPVMLYNIPGRTSRNMEAATIGRLAEVPNIVGVKESTGDFQQAAAIAAGTPDDFALYSGDDWATLHILLLGGVGVVSVASHLVGQQMRDMMTKFQSGDHAGARAVYFELRPLFDALFQPTAPSPAGVKCALALVGFEVGGHRLPLVPVNEQEDRAMQQALVQVGLL